MMRKKVITLEEAQEWTKVCNLDHTIGTTKPIDPKNIRPEDVIIGKVITTWRSTIDYREQIITTELTGG
jgi:hypothetical protein